MIELLSPARDLATGRAAIEHGADAVYIGAPHHGARAAATNTTSDIGELCRFARQFGAKVYATVNTLIYDNELDDVQAMITELEDTGIDAILVQDMAITRMRHRVPLHASTQTDASSIERVQWLRDMGFQRVVLARELSIDEIAAIHKAVPDVELEAFVHGALCVSASGLCYASEHCFRRSANRGQCAQFCRLPFDLIDADGNILEHARHLLSLRDLNQIDHLKELIDAGVVSLKIEGRLKDISYVAGVTAAYNQRLCALGCQRTSYGQSRPQFKPDLERVFHRPYTDFFAHGRQRPLASTYTPKAIGEYVGEVKDIRRDHITVAGITTITSGDGLCFFDDNKQLQGFRANRTDCSKIYLRTAVPGLHKGTRLYRNADTAFDKAIAAQADIRQIPTDIRLEATNTGYRLTMTHDHLTATAEADCEHQKARTPQADNIQRILSKLGGTVYQARHITLPDDEDIFIPASILTKLRQDCTAALTATNPHPTSKSATTRQAIPHAPFLSPNYNYNIANAAAADIYRQAGITGRAYELSHEENTPLMTCRYCLRYELGHCLRDTREATRKDKWKEPLTLRLDDGRTFPLRFDCRHCRMYVLAPTDRQR